MADLRWPITAPTRATLLALLLFLTFTGCGDNRLPRADLQGQGASAPVTFESAVSEGGDDPIIVDASRAGIPIDRRLLGTNLPAWIGPDVLADPDFRQRALDTGTTVVRMPGGSWSNVYDWLGCEQGDAETCFWTWAARPTDFIEFLEATGIDGMWTVSINDTAQKSAAAVAFFNGDVDDPTPIGVDRFGTDWGDVSDWAQLRVANGNTESVGISLWEVGNEVYGATPSNGGEQCAPFGWEEVWTCDGTEYVEGTDGHDGALAIRAAMLEVDPDIEVGLVGVSDHSAWGGFGNDVVAAAGDSIDFYVVHHYGFDRSPDTDQALAQPEKTWSTVIEEARLGLPAEVPLAVTEYNLVSIESADTDQSMTRAVNAFYLAASIGELAKGKVEIANWWNLANGVTQSGTDYGLISVEDDRFDPSPAFEAFAMWGRAGTSLIETTPRPDGLLVYPTRHDDGRLTILVINLDAEPIMTKLVIEGLADAADFQATIEVLSTEDLNATELTVTAVEPIGSPESPLALAIAPWSVQLIEVQSVTS